MKVAVITPYYKEASDVLEKCHSSVRSQTYSTDHILVADGFPNKICDNWHCQHIILPHAHNDAGATPRALAAISAFSRGYDAVGFLDADNWIDADHVEQMVNTVSESGAAGAIATRRIHSLDDGRELYVDLIESNGENMVDTNCMFLTKSALHFMSYWITPPGQELWSDRYFWNAIKLSKISIARCTKPTVAYVTKWAWHYKHAGVVPPPDSVWITKDAAGNLKHVKHKDIKE